MDPNTLDPVENRWRMQAGELYYAWTPDLTEDRNRCKVACAIFNRENAAGAQRRRLVELWKDIVPDERPLPPPTDHPNDDFKLLADYPYVDGPIKFDYGIYCKFGPQVYINSNCTFLDTCLITVGARTLIGPNCSFYSATHPTDPFVRNGLSGPESGKPITIGEDCWFGGNVVGVW
ncbi:hypothetical protein VTI74DRAFT_1891 [Chaetomium olivicolor]